MSQDASRNVANVAVLVGSLRKESFNRKMAGAAIELAPPSLKLEIVEIGQLPFHNQDLDSAQPPAPWVEFRQRLKAAEAVLFVTPEYNRDHAGRSLELVAHVELMAERRGAAAGHQRPVAPRPDGVGEGMLQGGRARRC